MSDSIELKNCYTTPGTIPGDPLHMNNPVDNQSPLRIPQNELRLPSKISENCINAVGYDYHLLNYTILAMT